MDLLKFYTKRNCNLCNEVCEILELQGFDWEEIDILENSHAHELYRHEIPVLECSGRIWRYRDRENTPLIEWLLALKS